MTVGFRILPRSRKVGAEAVARFRTLPVANVSDVMARMTAGRPAAAPDAWGRRPGRPGATVKTRPGDNLMIHKAIDMAEPGDVIVVDGGGDLTNALIGELMLARWSERGLAGIVLNGAIRDSAAIRARRFPVFAAGVTHRGPYKDGPGEINVPIAIDGMVIEPGDLILGDDDGLLCVPFDAVEAVHAAATQKAAAEARQMREHRGRHPRRRLGRRHAAPPGLRRPRLTPFPRERPMPDAAKPAVLVTAAKLAPEAVAILEAAGYAVPCTSGYPSEAELLAAIAAHRPIALLHRQGIINGRGHGRRGARPARHRAAWRRGGRHRPRRRRGPRPDRDARRRGQFPLGRRARHGADARHAEGPARRAAPACGRGCGRRPPA